MSGALLNSIKKLKSMQDIIVNNSDKGNKTVVLNKIANFRSHKANWILHEEHIFCIQWSILLSAFRCTDGMQPVPHCSWGSGVSYFWKSNEWIWYQTLIPENLRRWQLFNNDIIFNKLLNWTRIKSYTIIEEKFIVFQYNLGLFSSCYLSFWSRLRWY